MHLYCSNLILKLQKTQDCVNVHLYCSIPDKLVESKFTQLLIAEECMDLKKLMARSIELTEALKDHATAKGTDEKSVKLHALQASLQDMDACVPLRNNFCNTFALMSVLPYHCEFFHPAQEKTHRVSMLLHTGLQIGHSHAQQHLHNEAVAMKGELERLEKGTMAYEEEKKRSTGVNLSNHAFMTSAQRGIVHVSELIHLQQALQQAYCMSGAQNQEIVMSEANSMSFAPSATCPQTHGSKTLFQVTCIANDLICQ